MEEYFDKLREIREDRHIAQREIAIVLCTTQQVYSRYGSGINEMPIRHLMALCKYYSVSADYMLWLCVEKR